MSRARSLGINGEAGNSPHWLDEWRVGRGTAFWRGTAIARLFGGGRVVTRLSLVEVGRKGEQHPRARRPRDQGEHVLRAAGTSARSNRQIIEAEAAVSGVGTPPENEPGDGSGGPQRPGGHRNCDCPPSGPSSARARRRGRELASDDVSVLTTPVGASVVFSAHAAGSALGDGQLHSTHSAKFARVPKPTIRNGSPRSSRRHTRRFAGPDSVGR